MTMLNEATYLARIVPASCGIKTGEKGDTFVIGLMLTGWVDGNGAVVALQPETERKLYLYWYGKAVEHTERKLASLGFNWDVTAMRFSEDAENIGIYVEIRHEDYQGRVVEKVELVGVGEQFVTDAAKLADINRRLRAKFGKPSAPPVPPRPPTAAAPVAPPKPIPPPPAKASLPFEPPPNAAALDKAKSAAWAACCGAWPDEAKRMAAWAKEVAGTAAGRSEDDMTVADWADVEAKAVLPFDAARVIA